MSISAFRARVRIQTPPRYDPATGRVVEGKTFGFDNADPRPDLPLLSIRTSKRVDQPCGRFQLTFAPVEVERGLFWSDVLPAYSLVEIFMQRFPEPERLVMLGLVDRGEVSEDFSSPAPQRQVNVYGREAGCIFVDQRTLYLPAPPEPLLAGEQSQTSRGLDLPTLYEDKVQLLGMLAIDPTLGYEGAGPVDVIDKFVQMATVGYVTDYNRAGVPLLDLRLPKRTLADLIVFDKEKAKRLLFDPKARLPAAGQEIRSGISYWELLETWCDPTYHEMWTRTVAEYEDRSRQQSRSDGVIEVVFRRRPFAGRIVNDELVEVAPPAGTQFAPDFLADPTETVPVSPEVVLSRTHGWDAAKTQNLYYVYPQFPNVDQLFQSTYQPLVDVGEHSPSDIRRLGLRMRKVSDYYFGEGADTALERAAARARLLWAWHRFEGIMKSGVLQVIGSPHYEVGKRLVEVAQGRHEREAYLTGVSHSLVFGSTSPAYRTALQFDRGWPLR